MNISWAPAHLESDEVGYAAGRSTPFFIYDCCSLKFSSVFRLPYSASCAAIKSDYVRDFSVGPKRYPYSSDGMWIRPSTKQIYDTKRSVYFIISLGSKPEVRQQIHGGETLRIAVALLAYYEGTQHI